MISSTEFLESVGAELRGKMAENDFWDLASIFRMDSPNNMPCLPIHRFLFLFYADMLTDFEAHVLCVYPLGEDLSLD